LISLLALSVPGIALASEPCERSDQVLPKEVCDFDYFYGEPPRQIPVGWNPFVLYGELTYMQDADTFWGAPSLRMWSVGGTFKAGIYTQARVTPGEGYRASISWGAPNAPDHFGRQLGLDPTGGTDPNAATVIWGPMHWGPGRILNYTNGQGPNIDVRARAVSETMTVFFLVDHPTSTGDNLIFIDVIGLYRDESAPPLAPTPEPPTATFTPAPVQRVEPVLPTPTPLPTETPTPSPTPTETPTPSPTVTPSPSPTATATPTWTPWPTATPGAPGESGGLSAATALVHDALPGGDPNYLLLLGLFSLSGAGIFGGSLWWMRRK
jgi:hypothetical protein